MTLIEQAQNAMNFCRNIQPVFSKIHDGKNINLDERKELINFYQEIFRYCQDSKQALEIINSRIN